MLVAIAIPVFTSQLEKSREATDMANIRSAYAQVVVEAIENNAYSGNKVVSLKQQSDDWATVGAQTTLESMHSNRIYRKGLPYDVIRAELVRGRGRQFDPHYLDAFLELFDSGALDRVVRQREEERAE